MALYSVYVDVESLALSFLALLRWLRDAAFRGAELLSKNKNSPGHSGAETMAKRSEKGGRVVV